MYCGDMVQGQHRMDGQVSKKLPESEWVITENTHEAIIAREVFDIVQELRDKFCEGQKGPRFTSPKSENAFRQKIFCSCCGFVMMRRRDGETYYGFKCNSRKLYSHHACGGMYLHETTLKKLLLGLLRRYGPALAQAMASLADTAPEESADTAAIAAIQVAVEKSQQYLSGLYESLVLGVITESEYSDLKSNYETKIASLTEQEKNLRDSARHHTERKTELAKAQESITTIIGKSEWTAQAIDKLVEKIHVYKGGKIGVKFIFMEDTVFSGEGVGDE
jgi:hypothetical protein